MSGGNTWPYSSPCIPFSSQCWYLDQLKMIRASSHRVVDPAPTIPETILSLYKNQTEKHNKVMLYV